MLFRAVGVAPKCSGPAGNSVSEAIERKSRASLRIFRACSSMRRPATVGCTVRPARFNNWLPTDPSSALKRRSEEHTSELQSLMRISYAVFCLKKKNKLQLHQTPNQSKLE